jgi:hypothetical protein
VFGTGLFRLLSFLFLLFFFSLSFSVWGFMSLGCYYHHGRLGFRYDGVLHCLARVVSFHYFIIHSFWMGKVGGDTFRFIILKRKKGEEFF